MLAAGGAYNKTGRANSFRNRTRIWEAPTSGAHARRDHWRPDPEMLFGRSEFGLAALTDGRVMAAGGDVSPGGYVESTWANLVEVLDPLTGRWNLVKNLTVPRHACVLAALPDGGALVIGGTWGGVTSTAVLPEMRLYCCPRCDVRGVMPLGWRRACVSERVSE